jgi:hypothetical protein
MAKKVFVTGATCLIASPIVSKLTLFLYAASAHGMLNIAGMALTAVRASTTHQEMENSK